MIPQDVMMDLATIGLSAEQARVVASMLARVENATASQAEAAAEVSRSKARARVQKWRDTHKSNVTERNETSQGVTKRLTGEGARVEDKPLTQKIEPQVREESKSPAKPSPRQRLEDVLSADLAEAVLDHRQRLRKPLTERAAKSLALEFAKFPDPDAAADRMIAKGWTSTDVNWPEAHPGGAPRAGPKVQKRGIGGALDDIGEFLDDGQINGTGDHEAPPGAVLGISYRAAQ